MRSDTELLDFLAGTKGTLVCLYGGELYPEGWRVHRRVPRPPNVATAVDFREAINRFIDMEAAPKERRSLL